MICNPNFKIFQFFEQKKHLAILFRLRRIFMYFIIIFLTLFVLVSNESKADFLIRDSNFELKIEGLFWRLDSTDSNGNSAAVSSTWAARVGLAYVIPFSFKFGFRPEIGGSYGKFENPTVYSFSNNSAASSFIGGSFYTTNFDESLRAELRYYFEQSIFSKNVNSILSLNGAQTHRIAIRGSMSLFSKNFHSNEFIVGLELSKPFTNSPAFGGVSSGYGWAVLLRSGYLLVTLGMDYYPNFGMANNSTQLSIGIDGLKIGF